MLSHRISHVIDIMATCLDVAGVRYPAMYDGNEITPLEGESFRTALSGKARPRERPLFWEHHGNRGMRDSEWKLVQKTGSDWELYNMSRDRTELDDLSASNRAMRAGMIKRYEAWAARCGVLPWPLARTDKT